MRNQLFAGSVTKSEPSDEDDDDNNADRVVMQNMFVPPLGRIVDTAYFAHAQTLIVSETRRVSLMNVERRAFT